jgi:DNA-binding Lrp family transcriptional regulator
MESDSCRKSAKITDEQVLALYGQKTVKEIAEELGVSKTAVLNRAKKMGITRREKRKKVDAEVKRQQGKEIVKRVEEFKPQLMEWIKALEQDINDYRSLERHLKDRIDEQVNSHGVRPECIERDFEQLFRIKDAKFKRLASLMLLIGAFYDAGAFGLGEKMYPKASSRQRG